MKDDVQDKQMSRDPKSAAQSTLERSSELNLAYEPPRLDDLGQLRALIRGVTGPGADFAQLAFE